MSFWRVWVPNRWHQPLTQQCGHCWEENWESWKKRKKRERRKRTRFWVQKQSKAHLTCIFHKKKPSGVPVLGYFSKIPLWKHHNRVFEPSTFLLGGNRANHSTTVPPHPWRNIWEGAFRLAHATRLRCISQVKLERLRIIQPERPHNRTTCDRGVFFFFFFNGGRVC